MKLKSAKNKGYRAVKELQALILQLFPELTKDDVVKPTGSAPGEDLILSARARGLLPISVEVKNREDFMTRKGWDAIEQSEENSEHYQPVVFFKRNNTKLRAIIDAAELLALLRIRAAWETNQLMPESLKNGKGD